MISNQTIKQAVDKIVAVANPRKVILFGSYAHGAATEDSDLDIMVVHHAGLLGLARGQVTL